MLVDSHCHLDCLDLSPYQNRLDNFFATAEQQGVERFLCVSINRTNYPKMLNLVESYPQVFVSVGVHPNEHNEAETPWEELVALAKHPKNIAIGETGLDYFRTKAEDFDWQRQRFRRHITAAKQANKPLIIHTRQAKQDTLDILRQEQAQDIGGVMHCFAEDWEMAKQSLDLGFYISFSGIVTFKNAHELKSVAKKVPADQFLVETDSPYLAPVPHRGKANYPHYVRHVAECLADLRQTSVASIAQQTTDNFFRLFSKANHE